MKNISVLVPVYGVEKYIEKFAFSLFSNTIASQCEFIFVNDKTKDNSITILNNVIKHFPELDIKIIEHEINKGLAGARNTGLKNATCDYVIFADSDDWVEPDYLEKLYMCAIQNNADIALCGFYSEFKGRIKKQFQKISLEQDNYLSDLIMDKIPGYLWCKLFKRSLFSENNFCWKEGINMWEDFYICSRLFFKAKRVFSINDCLYHYRLDNMNSIVNNNSILKNKETFYVIGDVIEFLKSENIYHLYKTEIQYRIVIVKLWFLKHNSFTKNTAKKILTKQDIVFMKKNLRLFSKKKRVLVYMLCKEYYTLANILCSLFQFIKKGNHFTFDYENNDISFFQYVLP